MVTMRRISRLLRMVNDNGFKIMHQTLIHRSYHKTALITGGTKGIGFRALQQLMEFNDMKFIIGTRNVTETKQIIENNEELKENENKNRIDIINLDITDQNSIIAATKHIECNYDNIDILMNMALIDNGSSLSKENLDKTFETNYYGNLNITTAMMPYLSTLENTKDIKNLSVYSSRIIFPFNRECALNKLSKSIQTELMKDGLSMNELNDLMDRFKNECINKKWDNFEWITNTYSMSIIGLNMFARINGNEFIKNRNNNHWIGSFCIDNNNTLTQNGSGLCKLSTMLIDEEDKNKNGCLWGGFFKAATNIDVDEDDGYVDDLELEILDWINPRNTISWNTMLDDLMFSNVTGEDQ